MKSKIQIIKASGEKVVFSVQKLRSSLARSGAGKDAIEAVVKEVESQLHDEMTTKKIYQLAFKILNRKHKPAASKYKLKKAIMELGPSGFPFEKYISELLLSQGHFIKLNVIMHVHSWFNDIVSKIPEKKSYKSWIVTNTRFSTDAIQYARCSELNLLGWDYPDNAGLRECIDQAGLYPVTCLTTMTQKREIKNFDSRIGLVPANWFC